MGRIRFILFVIVVFLGTMGVYFYIRVNRLYDRQAKKELGDPKTAGFREVFLADCMLVDPKGADDNGNSPEAERLAKHLRTHFIAELGEELGFPTEADPKQIQMPRVYCLRRGKYCMFLVYVPAMKKLSVDEQRTVALALWPQAQKLAAGSISGYPTVGLGLRGHRLYGPIMVGAKRGDPLLAQEGGRYVFYPYFAGEPSLPPLSPAAAESSSVAEKSPAANGSKIP